MKPYDFVVRATHCPHYLTVAYVIEYRDDACRWCVRKQVVSNRKRLGRPVQR